MPKLKDREFISVFAPGAMRLAIFREMEEEGQKMIRIKDYNHIGIVVRDLEKSKLFYGEILGLKTIFRPPFNFPGHWYQVGPGTQLHLMVYDEAIPRTMRHTALEVEDFDKALEHLKKSGVTIVEGPGKRYDGSDFLFCKDPDGNLVEITKH